MDLHGGMCAIKYTPLCGTGPHDPCCGLLEFGDALLMLDCGWSEACNVEHLAQIER
jgi:hypothetical protein